MDVIQVERIRKRFGNKDALADVSFSIPKGKFLVSSVRVVQAKQH